MQEIVVKATPYFVEKDSCPASSKFVWGYSIEIENDSNKIIQLLKRHWTIVNDTGMVKHVEGDGVVGEKPVLRPGEIFEYTSGADLNTPSGVMLGRYEMADEDGNIFDVEIPAISLDSPHKKYLMN